MINPLLVIIIIIALSFVIIFVIPFPISIEYCNAEFMQNTIYELQTKCWYR